MAAIDKMYLKDYYVFDEFRLWCLIHNPKLLNHFYHWNMTQQEWEEIKDNKYQILKEIYDIEFAQRSTIESLQKDYKKVGYNPPIKQLEYEVSSFLAEFASLKDVKTYIENIELSIAHLSPKEDKYLLWHCPIEEVREYLTKQCGYKERWFYKLFFKY